MPDQHSPIPILVFSLAIVCVVAIIYAVGGKDKPKGRVIKMREHRKSNIL